MDYIVIGLSGVCLLVSLFILGINIKNRRNDTNSLSEYELDKIKKVVVSSINDLSNSISNLVAEKNKVLMDEIKKDVLEVKNNIDLLIKDNKDFILQSNQFNEKLLIQNNNQKEEMINKIQQEMNRFNGAIKEKLEDFKNDTKDSIKSLNETVNKNLGEIREDNNKKLDKINESVNDKLQKTLESKLKDSFDNVIKQITNVNTAVGEIKGLATDVSSLKNVLANVKVKGIIGEVILGNIIKEFLTTNQYEENIATKVGSNERVEYAIKLPGSDDKQIYLPVDSKFPYVAYQSILEGNNLDQINESKKQLRRDLLKYAKEVSDKYIDVPNTTDFAVIFLPLEGLYLEALNMGLFEEIQQNYKVNLTGPTTFTAFINSIQIGFKSLMIQKKSSDVFKLLAAIKTEFNKFADALDKTQKKVNQAADELDNLVGTRTRMMNSKLKSIEALDEKTARLLLEDNE